MLLFLRVFADLWPLLVCGGGGALVWRLSRKESLTRRSVRLSAWIVFHLLWYGFFGTNIWTAQVLVNVEKLCIRAQLRGATEDAVLSALGEPESRQVQTGTNDPILSYRVSPWWSMWEEGCYIGFERRRAASFMNWE